jgi:hypothetical protein
MSISYIYMTHDSENTYSSSMSISYIYMTNIEDEEVISES